MDFKDSALMSKLLLALCVTMVAGGCAIYRQTADASTDPVRKDKLGKLSKGDTTKQDIVEALGEPTRTLKSGEGHETLVYEYEWREETKYNILFIFTWTDQDERTSKLFFELKDGVLVRHWREVVSSEVEVVD